MEFRKGHGDDTDKRCRILSWLYRPLWIIAFFCLIVSFVALVVGVRVEAESPYEPLAMETMASYLALAMGLTLCLTSFALNLWYDVRKAKLSGATTFMQVFRSLPQNRFSSNRRKP
ncbi:hypothetical protein HQ544_02835 [Candidatus Falkowbacteria bacterium]|nr:hypothetical protein [Candidatus Falkowbacteria bacterium]